MLTTSWLYGVSGEREPRPHRLTPLSEGFIYFDTCGLVSIIYPNAGEAPMKAPKCLTAATVRVTGAAGAWGPAGERLGRAGVQQPCGR